MPRFACDDYTTVGWATISLQEQDEVARRTRWQPCGVLIDDKEDIRGQAEVSPDRIERKSKGGNIWVQGCAMCLLLLLTFAGISALLTHHTNIGEHILFSTCGLLVAVPCGLVFLVTVFVQIPNRLSRHYFDRGRGYSLGRDCAISQPDGDIQGRGSRNPRRGQIDEIYALQVLRKFYVKDGLEVNLVLESGYRVNFIKSPLSQGPSMMKQVRSLSEFLDVDIWNASTWGTWKFHAPVKFSRGYSLVSIAKNVGHLLSCIWLGITKQYDQLGHWQWIPSRRPSADNSTA